MRKANVTRTATSTLARPLLIVKLIMAVGQQLAGKFVRRFLLCWSSKSADLLICS